MSWKVHQNNAGRLLKMAESMKPAAFYWKYNMLGKNIRGSIPKQNSSAIFKMLVKTLTELYVLYYFFIKGGGQRKISPGTKPEDQIGRERL